MTKLDELRNKARGGTLTSKPKSKPASTPQDTADPFCTQRARLNADELELVSKGKRIQAIKSVMGRSRLSLAQAKTLVEDVENSVGKDEPMPKPKPARVRVRERKADPVAAKTADPTNPHPSEIVELSGGRLSGPAVIVSKRRITRGRHAGKFEYQLAPLTEGQWGKSYGAHVTGERFFKRATREFTAEHAQKCRDGHWETVKDIEKHKEERAEAGREAMGDDKYDYRTGKTVTDKMAPGDTVRIGWRNGARDETLVEINPATGKIAIRAPHNKSRKRWIPATLVLEVKCPRQKLPCSISDANRAILDAEGWVQVRFGSEFIESSYVIAKTREDARKGSTYEGGSAVVNEDPDTGLFWRSTGSFD